MMTAKFLVLSLFLSAAEAAVVNQKVQKIRGAKLVEKLQAVKINTSATHAYGEANYGNKDCQCIGVDELEGDTTATLKGGKQVNYPADLGARCEAWDKDKHPSCPGEDWCEQKWCYVDPCKCKLRVLPKPSNYIPGGKYQGRPLYFSYVTCKGQDSYTEEKDMSSVGEIERMCKNEYVDEKKWGPEECRCVGIGGQSGSTKVTIDGSKHEFPADTGAYCNTWEQGRHPDCTGSSPPAWCSKSWCYVDPCSCRAASPPKVSSYLPDSNFQGRPVYFSYEACGSEDAYTAGNKEACVNQKSDKDCAKLSRCAWNGKHCLGKELVEVCSSASGLKALLVLLVPVLLRFL